MGAGIDPEVPERRAEWSGHRTEHDVVGPAAIAATTAMEKPLTRRERGTNRLSAEVGRGGKWRSPWRTRTSVIVGAACDAGRGLMKRDSLPSRKNAGGEAPATLPVRPNDMEFSGERSESAATTG